MIKTDIVDYIVNNTTLSRSQAINATDSVIEAISHSLIKGESVLLIEMKTIKGRQSESQKKWQKTVCFNEEYKYVVCRSFDDFKREVDEYLRNE